MPIQGPQNVRFGGGVAETVLNPFVLVAIVVAGILICLSARKRAITAFLLASILIPTDQVLLIGRLHFPMLRLLLAFGFARLARDKFFSKLLIFARGINQLDIAVLALAVVTAINAIILFQESAAVINQLGTLYTVFGIYLLMRSLVRDEDDVVTAIKSLTYVAILVATIMSIEFTTGHSPYALLGGARASYYASLAARDERFRAQGPFSHPILAGTFGAVLLPLFVSLSWKGRKMKLSVIAGLISSTIIVVTCNSSTPILAYVSGILGLCLWPLRRSMRVIRWVAVITLVFLHLIMKAPVWHLIARIDLAGGSSGYHRYMLVDQCIRHFGDWWLIGVKDTSSWGWDMWDVANQYVSTCDSSGLLAFALFVAVLVYSFRFIARARQTVERNHHAARFRWAIGAALFSNAVAFFGISYWDQTQVAWYTLLAAICAVAIKRREMGACTDCERSASTVSQFEPTFCGYLNSSPGTQSPLDASIDLQQTQLSNPSRWYIGGRGFQTAHNGTYK